MLLAFGVCAFSDRIDPYYLDVMIGVGINVILAVSLNLVNGYTGQFSLGHAGFMSVGAYLSAAVTLLLGPGLLGEDGGTALQQGLLFLAALLWRGAGAALAGLAVGIPSLRLKGDYLALVTLGFGEIIRVIFQNVDALGGALGLNGIPNYTNVFWVLRLRGRSRSSRSSASSARPTAAASSRRRTTRSPPRPSGWTRPATRSWPSWSGPSSPGSPEASTGTSS